MREQEGAQVGRIAAVPTTPDTINDRGELVAWFAQWVPELAGAMADAVLADAGRPEFGDDWLPFLLTLPIDLKEVLNGQRTTCP